MALATVNEIKAELGISGTADDAKLTAYLEEVTDLLDAWTGQEWEPVTATRYFHAVEDVAGGGRDLLVPYITSLDSAVITNGDGESVASYCVLVRNVRIRLKANSGRRWNWNGADDPTDAISVNSAQWGRAAVPARVREFAVQYCAWRYRNREVGGLSASLITTQGGTTVLTPNGLPAELRAMLVSLVPASLG